MEPAWRAWEQLHGERPYQTVGVAMPMGGTLIQSKPGPIPWSAVQSWCDRARYDEVDREFILRLVAVMDRELIAHWSRQQQRGTAPAPFDDKLARWENA